MRQEYWILLIGWIFTLLWVPLVIATNRKAHPKVLFYLFMVELWERFSFYGMRAFLVLYLVAEVGTGGFAMDKKAAYALYAAYGALVYLTPLAGGFLADKILGFRRAIIIGAILMAAGQFTLSASLGNKTLVYAGLALLVTGNGFFKPNISSLIGKFYPQGDPRRDRAFTIFYMGINTGAFISPLTCGAVAQLEGWNYGFLLAGTGMVAGLLLFLYTSSRGFLEKYADPPVPGGEPVSMAVGEPGDVAETPHPTNGRSPVPTLAVLAGALAFLPLAGWLMYENWIMNYILGIIGFAAIAFMIGISFQYPQAERQRIWVIVVLLFFVAVFWGFFELAGSALNVFTDTHVDKSLGTWMIPASVFQAVNAVFIMLFAPVFTLIWAELGKRNLEPAAPVKFAFGLLLLGCGFLVLNLGRGSVDANAIMPLIFLILMYLLHTFGELALSPVGLSLVTKLAPAKVVGFMMGFWFLSSAIGFQVGGWISGETAAEKELSKHESLDLALGVFTNVGLFALGSGVFLLILSPVLKKWMHGVK